MSRENGEHGFAIWREADTGFEQIGFCNMRQPWAGRWRPAGCQLEGAANGERLTQYISNLPKDQKEKVEAHLSSGGAIFLPPPKD